MHINSTCMYLTLRTTTQNRSHTPFHVVDVNALLLLSNIYQGCYLAFLSLSESRLLLPLMSRFRRFSSAFRSITLSSDNLRTPGSTGPTSAADESDMLAGCEDKTADSELWISPPRTNTRFLIQRDKHRFSKQNGAAGRRFARALSVGNCAHARYTTRGLTAAILLHYILYWSILCFLLNGCWECIPSFFYVCMIHFLDWVWIFL